MQVIPYKKFNTNRVLVQLSVTAETRFIIQFSGEPEGVKLIEVGEVPVKNTKVFLITCAIRGRRTLNVPVFKRQITKRSINQRCDEEMDCFSFVLSCVLLYSSCSSPHVLS